MHPDYFGTLRATMQLGAIKKAVQFWRVLNQLAGHCKCGLVASFHTQLEITFVNPSDLQEAGPDFSALRPACARALTFSWRHNDHKSRLQETANGDTMTFIRRWNIFHKFISNEASANQCWTTILLPTSLTRMGVIHNVLNSSSSFLYLNSFDFPLLLLRYVIM